MQIVHPQIFPKRNTAARIEHIHIRPIIRNARGGCVFELRGRRVRVDIAEDLGEELVSVESEDCGVVVCAAEIAC